MRILGISGSLQRGSTNTALIDIARARAPEGVEVLRFDGLAQIPPCNPDLEPAPPEVAAFRALVQSADGLLIATPEYAHGLPGTLKNALDWLVGSGELYDKRVVIVSAAPSQRAREVRACRSGAHAACPRRRGARVEHDRGADGSARVARSTTPRSSPRSTPRWWRSSPALRPALSEKSERARTELLRAAVQRMKRPAYPGCPQPSFGEGTNP